MKRQLEIFSSGTFVWPFLSYCLPGKSLILTKNKQQKHANSKLQYKKIKTYKIPHTKTRNVSQSPQF